MTLAELAEASGTPERTIRFYITRGLLDGPMKAGRGAAYEAGHLARLENIKRLQNEGRMLGEIAQLLQGSPPLELAAPAPWWQYPVGEDVFVWVRGDTSPWRLKQIRDAIQEMESKLAAPNNNTSKKRREGK
jgi:DNA-binding transcriptional MerR regulator